jgi:hypothetical protein
MPKNHAISLRNLPDHAAIIGGILLGYTDLEFFMLDLVAQAIAGDDDFSTAARILYRLRGAHDRLNVADAIVRPFMEEIKLEGPYCQWLGAMRRCRVIRNQYAHCTWKAAEGRAWFADLEKAAQGVEGEAGLRFVPLDLPLLEEQFEFFRYTAQVIFYLMDETKFRRDRRRRHKSRLPKSLPVPNLHSPLD